MTKVTILGQSRKDVKPKKKIEFVQYLDCDLKFELIEEMQEPKNWDNIILLEKSYTFNGLDLMYAFNENFARILVLGHFNDGEV